MAVQFSQLLENNRKELEKFVCRHCDYLLRDPVQQMCCGHWLCECCAKELGEKVSPCCPQVECQEPWNMKEGYVYFPDRFVRKSLSKLSVKCSNDDCDWIGTMGLLNNHLAECAYSKTQCLLCQEWLATDEVETHRNVCRERAMTTCCFSELGCDHRVKMNREELASHLTDGNNLVKHLEIIAKHLNAFNLHVQQPAFTDEVEKFGVSIEADIPTDQKKYVYIGSATPAGANGSYGDKIESLIQLLRVKDTEVTKLLSKVSQLEKAIQSKSSEGEDRDFRLSLIDNINYDGTMIWKIPQFSQRMEDARSGKYPSIFSLPFYSGRYGYKMCLRLYILGDGIGKNTHMSLFFVIMKGEFDAILQWPFTHKVSFRLINQDRGQDIVDVFQPDPLSSSFQRPKTDMNMASGCPCFISLSKLEGFIIEDTIWIMAEVDLSTTCV